MPDATNRVRALLLDLDPTFHLMSPEEQDERADQLDEALRTQPGCTVHRWIGSRLADGLGAALDAAFAALADGRRTEDGIAARLRAHDCTGHIRACATCPVALWLQAELTAAGFPNPLVSVTSANTTVTAFPRIATIHAKTRTPQLVGTFICAFDNGAYPHLTAGPKAKPGIPKGISR